MNRFNRPRADQVRFRTVLESGALVNEIADVIETQIVASESQVSLRHPGEIAFYKVVGEGRLKYDGSGAMDTGHAPIPGTDSRYCNEDMEDLHKGIKLGTLMLNAPSLLMSNKLTTIHYIAAILVFAVCAWGSGIFSSEDKPVTAATVVAAQAEPTEGDDRVAVEVVESIADIGEQSGEQSGELEGAEGPGAGRLEGDGREGDQGPRDDAGQDRSERVR